MKKLLSISLIIFLSLSEFSCIFADSYKPNNNKQLLKDMNKQISLEFKKTDKYLIDELNRQNAIELLPVYEEYFYNKIEEQIKKDYVENKGLVIYEERRSRKKYKASNGGNVAYLSPVSGGKPTEVSVICMNRSDSYDYILNKNSFNTGNLVELVLGFLPNGYGTMFSFVSAVKGYVDKAANTSVRNAGGYAEVISSYSREYDTSASITTGWTDRPYIYIPSNAYNIEFNEK